MAVEPLVKAREVRLRSARARAKACEVMAETMRDPAFPKTLLIAGSADLTRWTVIPGGMFGREMAEALMAAAEGVTRLAEHESQIGHAGEPVRIDISERGEGPHPDSLGRQRRPETTIAADGALQAPRGETFLYCGECSGTRWFATTRRDGSGGRLVCVGCANEIFLHRTTHEAGTA
jgi:hypothetical protein